MPNFDQTGPQGLGQMTGRGLGPCNRGLRRGFGRGLGRGFGWKAQTQVITEAEEKQILKTDLKDLKAEMQEIEKRLKELKA